VQQFFSQHDIYYVVLIASPPVDAWPRRERDLGSETLASGAQSGACLAATYFCQTQL
jgi:hypothetical protein